MSGPMPPYTGTRLGIAKTCCLLLTLLCATSGCVQRRLLVRTNPPGATVYVDNVEIGKSPTAVNYTYYGTRQIRIEREGYETIDEFVRMRPPFYEIPPLDFVSETMVPVTIVDGRTLDYTLRPETLVPREQLFDRANGLRGAAQMGNLPPAAVQGLQPPPVRSLPPHSTVWVTPTENRPPPQP